ncbi:MAG: hypothetical protein EHM45_20080 [Desulfobacteraceae bacterium]|nr:MAG: hypothetical protein EHM45_20080 [Desulfobacteraceae bacterium]
MKEYDAFSKKTGFAKAAHIAGWTVVGLGVAVIFAFLFGILVQWLWAVTLTPLFGFPAISYWQAVGIIILARLLFGGWGHGPGRERRYPDSGGCRDHFPWRHKPGKNAVDAEESAADHKHYAEFWRKQGKQAFEEYLKRMEEENEKPAAGN